MHKMKIALVTTVLFGLAWSFPEDLNNLKFKRLYVDPVEPLPEYVSPRITHGVEAAPHSIPYQAYLIVTGADGRWLCGGSLISRKFVLTAGHCVYGATSATVYLGAHNVKTTEATQLRITSRVVVWHEDYDEGSISNDIGVIELPEEVELNEYINVTALPTRQEAHATYENDESRVSGWGLTDGLDTSTTSPVLLEVNATVIDNQSCNNIYGIVQNYEVCTSGDGGVGSCSGDSGGPLVTNNKQIGIVSYGVRYCLAGYPSVFTRTNSFLDWLEENTDLTF